MRARNRDHHRRLADLQPAGAVRHRHARFGPFFRDLTCDLAHLRPSHLAVRLVLEVSHRATARGVADDADESADGAGALVGDRRFEAARIEWIGGELEQNADSVRAATHRRDEGDFIPVRDDDIPISKFLVDRRPHGFAVYVQTGMCLPQRVVNISDRRAGANLDVLGIGTGQLAQAREQPRAHRNRDCHHRILGGLLTNTWTSLPESSARSTVARVPLDAPSQKATSTSHASTRRWLRAADLLASASSSNDAGRTWSGMPLARAALVAAASTPLALPVMIEAPRAKELT